MQSTIKAKICIGNKGACQVAQFEKLIKDLDKRINTPVLIINNAIAKELAKTQKLHSKAKHIKIKEIFIQDNIVLRNRLVVQYIPSIENIADALTKQPPKLTFVQHLQGIGMAQIGTLVL